MIPSPSVAVSPPQAQSQPAKGRSILVPVVLACIAAWLPYIRPLIAPAVIIDDYEILAQSRTWQRTLDGMWIPQNEHIMPLGRLLTFILEQLVGRLTLLPETVTLIGPVGLLIAMLLVYVFVRRELGHPLYGLLALVLFGVSTVYHQAVYWFAASFSMLALDTMLLGLLAVQRWRQTARGRYLVLAALACFLAPGWFAIGILGGPLCCLYLLVLSKRERVSYRSWLLPALTPMLGTVLFLAVSLPISGQRI